MTNVMTVAIDSPENADTHYQVRILDDHGNPLQATVLVDAAGRLEVRVPNVQSAQNYYVQVQDADLTLTQPADFDVVVDFAQDATHLQPFVNESLGSNQIDFAATLRVLQSQQFRFVLSATDWSAPAETGVRMTIYNADGQTVFTTAVADGASRSADVFLNAGQYTVRFTRANDQGDMLTPITFELSGMTESDPLGPQLRDTTLGPVDSVTSPAAPSVTFFWLPYTPADLTTGGLASLISTNAEPIALGASSSLLMQPGTPELPLSSPFLNVVGLSIVQPGAVPAGSITNFLSSWSLNLGYGNGPSPTQPSLFSSEGALTVNGNRTPDSPIENGQGLSPFPILETRLAWLPLDLKSLRIEVANPQAASSQTPGRTMALDAANSGDEANTEPAAADFCQRSEEASDLSLLGYLARVMGMPALVLTLFFPYARGITTTIPRLLRGSLRPRSWHRRSSSGDRFSERDGS